MTRGNTQVMLVWALAAGVLAGPAVKAVEPPASAAVECPASTTAPATRPRPVPAKDVPVYRIYPLRNGRCVIGGQHALAGGDERESYDYTLYIWLILGGDRPILVDAGLNDVAEMNRGAAHVLRQPIVQSPEETTRVQLGRFGLKPEDIGHVFVTHLHFDHVDGLDDFPRARIYIGRKEWELATADDGKPSWGHGRIMAKLRQAPAWSRRLVLVEDQKVLPGFESFWVGGHTPGSMAYRVNTAFGKAVLTGDTVSLLKNMETPIGVYANLDEVRSAMEKIRQKADIVLPSHDPGTPDRWPPLPPGTPRYTIRALRVGECQVRDFITFQDLDEARGQATRTFLLYVWLIEGAERPILVETGPNPKYLEAFNRGTAAYIPGGVKQRPEENTLAVLRRVGVEPAEVSHVIVTHAHADHYDYFDAFVNARLVINRGEFQENVRRLTPEVRSAVASRPGALQLVEDEEIVPGIRAVPLGCHTPGSQGVLVQTHLGPVLLAGDVVYLYENIEANRPTRSPDPQACRDAMARIRALTDIVLPAHDPLTLERWPGGIIGGLPSTD